jgi:hypothetical protein
MARQRLEYLLGKDWEESWNSARKIHPPADDPRNFVTYLAELGIVRQRGDGRFDVPDLYQYGLGLTRKGGVSRR